MTSSEIRYLLFDIESISDPLLVASVRHPGEEIAPDEALKKYREELMENKGSDFVPYTFQVPVSLALAKIRSDYSLAGIRVLKCEDGGPAKITKDFWTGWKYYEKPTFVTFNGRGFDIPLMELAALRYGISVPEWFTQTGPASPRNRYNMLGHLDLYSYFSNFNAVSMTGGLNLLSKLIGKPGKMDTHGDMVQDMFYAGKLAEVHSYCRCDVIDTYFLFLRYLLLTGSISSDRETELIAEARLYLEQESEEHPIYAVYLDAWDKAVKAPSFDDYITARLSAQKAESAEDDGQISSSPLPSEDVPDQPADHSD